MKKRADFIKIAVETRYMPPFYADVSFQTYHNQRILSQTDIQTIAAWVNDGAKEGKLIKNNDDKISRVSYPVPDLVFNMQKPFLIPATNTEQFRVFIVPTNTTEDLFVSGIGFVPSAKKLAHHSRVMIDTTHLLRPDDGIEVGEPSEFQRLNIKLADQFWHGWVPGNFPDFLSERIC